MGTYAVTGSFSGIGEAVATRLKSHGHRVVTIDLRGADVIADLSTEVGRHLAAGAVLDRTDGSLDGAVMAAGVGPARVPDRARQILQVNYFGVVDLLQAWRPALAQAGSAKVVVVGSNATTTVPAVPTRAVKALLAGDAAAVLRRMRDRKSVV